MALENAKKFLEQVMADEALRERAAKMEPAGVADIAKEVGFDVTAEELDAAVRAMRQAAGEEPRELDLDEMGKTAGGAFGMGEDAPDGHEMGCMLTYHSKSWHIENNIWCKKEWYCNATYRDLTRGQDAK